MSATKDLIGSKFGKLTVIAKTDSRNASGSVMWKCRCKCGRKPLVSTAALMSGNTLSCGCSRDFRGDTTSQRLGVVFSGMKNRCYNKRNPAYRNYGGRGIYICSEWLDDRLKFIEWAKTNGYSEGLTIDRIDNDGPYAPWNCRWITKGEQNRNKRSNHIISVCGISKPVSAWAEQLGDDAAPKLLSMVRKHRSDKVIEDWLKYKLFGGPVVDTRKPMKRHTSMTEFSKPEVTFP